MTNSSAPLRNLLDALKRVSVVVADTGDFNQLEEYQAQDATTNPTLILAASQVPDYKSLINDAIAYGRKSAFTGEDLITLICDRLCVNFGKSILEIIPGVVSTEVDAMLSFDTTKSVEKARRLIQMYEEVGVPRERVLIKLASTWEGIKAAEVLEKESIRCNLTLLFSLCQAIAAAEANATLISPFVGRILDWHKSKCPAGDYEGFNDPGVQSVTQIYNYYKRFGYKTVVMGASFRNTSEILALAGCDKLTVSPKLLKELQSLPCPPEGELVPQLSVQKASSMQLERVTMNESTFRWMLNEDAMATEKLSEGIRNFHKDGLKLRQFVRGLLSEQ